MFGDWSTSQTRNNLTKELNLLHLISENRFSHQKLPATLIEVNDITSSENKQATSAFGMSKGQNTNRHKLNIDTTNLFNHGKQPKTHRDED
jgi:hypothetical protein